LGPARSWRRRCGTRRRRCATPAYVRSGNRRASCVVAMPEDR